LKSAFVIAALEILERLILLLHEALQRWQTSTGRRAQRLDERLNIRHRSVNDPLIVRTLGASKSVRQEEQRQHSQ
jgi:hypothetical protein